jgi:hypothetical protein
VDLVTGTVEEPVLMNTTRSLAALMQALRLTVVRRSSSMIPP